MFVYELNGCGFESRCSHLNLRYHVCFEWKIPWHSRNSRVWIYSETCTWHNKNIQPCFWYWECQKVKGFTKLYFYEKTNDCVGTRIIPCVVIILLNTGLRRCAFSNISSEKLVLRSPVLSVFFILNKKFV